jgi:hypothetical protein
MELEQQESAYWLLKQVMLRIQQASLRRLLEQALL